MLMWIDIPNYEEHYEINDNGVLRNKHTGKIIKHDVNSSGYHRVSFYYGKQKRYFVHRIVASLFVPNPQNFKEVNHKDGNKNNNDATNLEWCDRVHNEREAHRTKIKEYKPFYIIKSNKRYDYEFPIDLAEELSLSVGTIKNWLKKRNKGYNKYKIQKIEYIK